MRTIHVYRAARTYFVDGIYWGDEVEGVRFYLQVTGVPPEEITKALEQVEQEGTYTGRDRWGFSHTRAIRAASGGNVEMERASDPALAGIGRLLS
jgi:hypothetical protein